MKWIFGIISASVALGCAHSSVAQTAATQPAATPLPASVLQPVPQRAERLLSEERIRARVSDPAPWLAYVERSRKHRAQDSVVMAAELRELGKQAMVPAPFGKGFEINSPMTPAWFASDSARIITDNLLSFQTPNGGWSKHVEYSKGPREKGQSWFSESAQWQWIATIDNSSTTEQMRFLVLRDSVKPDQRYKDAYMLGLRYLFASQFPNGCWPQVWPLDGGYHDAATFNDDAITNVLTTLQQASNGNPSFVPAADGARAAYALARGIACVLQAQYRDNGRLTVWGQQHDPLTLTPTNARSYELTSLTAQESANLMRFLIKLKNPSPDIVKSVHAAASWLREHSLTGYTYDFETGRHVAPGEGPIWARMYEIGTNRPMFSDRNGIKLYDWDQLKDRRLGYGWYTYAPVLALRQYDAWAKKNPQ